MENLPPDDNEDISLRHIDNAERPPPNPAAGNRKFYKHCCCVSFLLLFICAVLCVYLLYTMYEQSEQTLETLEGCRNLVYQLQEKVNSCEKQLKECNESSSVCEQHLNRLKKLSEKELEKCYEEQRQDTEKMRSEGAANDVCNNVHGILMLLWHFFCFLKRIVIL